MSETQNSRDLIQSSQKKAAGGASQGGSPGISSKGLFNPPVGTTKLRFILAKELNKDGEVVYMPYMTHTYHEFPDKNAKEDAQGKRIYVPLRYDDQRKDPIQEYVNAGFSLLEKNPNFPRKEEFSKYLKKIKRRRNQIAHAIHIPDMNNEKSKEIGLRHVFFTEGMKGIITRKICAYMKIDYAVYRLPDYVQIDDKFVIPGDDVDIVNIFGIEDAHDFNIIKQKGEGRFDVSLADSQVASKPRPLTDEEKEIYLNHGKSLKDPFAYASYEDALENLYDSLAQWGFSQNFSTEVEKYVEENRLSNSRSSDDSSSMFDNADAVLAELDDTND